LRGIALMGSAGFRRSRRSRASTRHGTRGGLRYRVDWLVACGRKAPAAVRALYSWLEQAFANFAQVPYHDARTLRELEQILDDLEGPVAGHRAAKRHENSHQSQTHQ
jgi:hypothetical protein